MKNWEYNLFKSHELCSKVFCFKYLGLLTLSKFWLRILVNSSASSFKELNSLTFQISISQYFVCTYSILLSFPLTFNIFAVLFSNYSFSTSLQQTLIQSYSHLFLNFCFHYSLNNVPSFSGFLMCITMKLRNAPFWPKWLSLVYKVNFSH